MYLAGNSQFINLKQSKNYNALLRKPALLGSKIDSRNVSLSEILV